MSDVIPALGSTGIYTFSAPFDTILPVSEKYTCQSVRSITELIASGVDVYANYYLSNSLTQGDYDAAVVNNTYIISLQSSIGVWAFVPANFIGTPRSVNGVGYNVVALGVSLGAIRVESDLSAIKTAISNLVRDNYGVTPIVKEIQVSKVKYITNENDLIINNARTALINNMSTDRAKLLVLQNNLDAALLKISGLETYIKNHYVL